MATLRETLDSGKLAGAWSLAADRSRVGFGNRTMWGIANVKGTFSDVRGGGQVAPPNVVDGQLDIAVASVDTKIGKRDEHLRSADFFDATQHPTIGVLVGSAEVTGPDSVDLHAKLTIKGIERPLDLPAKVSMLDDGAVRITAEADVDRNDFGVDGNMIGMVGKTTKLSADLVFVKSQ